ncbi:MAG TPA: ribonucleotide reductase subunit alpha [Hydrogenophaga sp.]|uniref:ribonucleotide reductase subunit alpha n=1 Tax=Hydrogenophaga sp. TaxID=1904254 RepID=UPI002BA44F38|nr:ribonucleotide reductase subunit alpha [Hydrogenophaga sp.]HMN94781.1 ribonucleotide reductase subunit alpha [Hydrogenophaga sp.]HMP12140.1 ribonucleotide reductase subunit alpha [Hydrogenophaga sp.]
MNISTFDDLLGAARSQPQPQRLLFVFAGIELPDDATPAQRAGFERGEGGALVPKMCVDKSPHELTSFEQLRQEAAAMGQPWGMVFVAAMSGPPGKPPTSADADQPLQGMVEAIRQGRIQNFIPFDPQGCAVQLG